MGFIVVGDFIDFFSLNYICDAEEKLVRWGHTIVFWGEQRDVFP